MQLGPFLFVVGFALLQFMFVNLWQGYIKLNQLSDGALG